MSIISLLDLPVEMLHLICDHLDVLTILRSLRYVCKHLHAVIDNYNRYTIDIRSTRISTFRYICAQIQSENIKSVIFSNDYRHMDRISLFFSIFDMSQFTRLHSLILTNVDESNRSKIFQLITSAQVQDGFYSIEIFMLPFISQYFTILDVDEYEMSNAQLEQLIDLLKLNKVISPFRPFL